MCRDEFDLDEILADPLTRMIMASDAVEEGHIRQLARTAGVKRMTMERDLLATRGRWECLRLSAERHQIK